MPHSPFHPIASSASPRASASLEWKFPYRLTLAVLRCSRRRHVE